MQQVMQQDDQSFQNIPRNRYKNAVTIKNEIGKSKQSMYTLPDQEFVYGKSSGNQQQKPQFQINEWNYPTHTSAKQPGRDFLLMNKMAIKDNIVDSRAQKQYRQQHEVRQQIKEGKKYQQIKLPETQFRYGVGNKPSTPISRIIQQEYASDTEKQYLQNYDEKIKNLEQIKKEKQMFFINKSHDQSVKAAGVYHKKQIDDADRIQKVQNFKLQKFRNVNSKLSKDDLYNQSYIKNQKNQSRRNQSVLPKIRNDYQENGYSQNEHAHQNMSQQQYQQQNSQE